jgi:ribosomal protein L7/L12
MSPQPPNEQSAPIQNALFQGQKLLAIKLYRELTGKGLGEAKAAIEKLEAELRKESPDKFAPGFDAKGCRKTAVLICLIAAGAIVWLIKR